jgi:hypothetical protein
MVAVAAAAAIVVIVGAVWMVYRSLGPHRNPNVIYQANLLDLREKSALRGAEANSSGAPIELPRGHWSCRSICRLAASQVNTRSKSWSSLASY